MTPYKQLFRHRPDQDEIGDCWRTCIACLLDRRPETVPHFVKLGGWDNVASSNLLTRAWLQTEKKLDFIELPITGGTGLGGVLSMLGRFNPGIHYLLGGNSKNGCGHSVVCLDDQIVWDPSLDDSGIVGPMDDNFYWATWLVPSLLRRF